MRVKLKRNILFFLVSFFVFFSSVFALNKAPVDITTMSIDDINDAFTKGYLNSELLVSLYLDRINEYDYLYNSINQINDNALEQARELDNERLEGKIRGPLHGIPILVKTNIDVKGLATTAGAKSLSDNYPNDDAYVIKKLIDSGAIILGSTNMSEFAFSAQNSYSSYGYVKNVFNNNYTSYGSSGGSAVSLGAAFAAASLGTDTNSSVRIPAAGAGVVGYRPTLGLISRSGVIPYDIERDTVGIMSKNISDNALLLSIISGEDKKDVYTTNFESYDYKEFEINNDMSDYTIGVVTQFINGTGKGITGVTNSDILNLTNSSIDNMKNAGANIVYIDEFYLQKNYSIATSTYAGLTMCDNINEYLKGTTGTMRSFQQIAKSGGHVQRLTGYAKGCNGHYKSKSYRDSLKSKYRTHVDNVFNKYNVDVIVFPAIKNKPYSYKSTGLISPGSYLSSVIGYPSITVPMGRDELGFSYSIEIVSTYKNDSKLLNIAGSFEKANGNTISSSDLVPSLYSVPDEVLLLKNIYENIDPSLYSDLYENIHSYFVNYNSNDNYIDDALNLVDKYNNYEVKTTKNNLNIISNKVSKKILIIILLVVILLLSVFKIVSFYCFSINKNTQK